MANNGATSHCMSYQHDPSIKQISTMYMAEEFKSIATWLAPGAVDQGQRESKPKYGD
jgi:hypothetical protein